MCPIRSDDRDVDALRLLANRRALMAVKAWERATMLGGFERNVAGTTAQESIVDYRPESTCARGINKQIICLKC